MFQRRHPSWVAWVFALSACEAPPPIETDLVIAAESVATEGRVVNSSPLPDAWGASLFVARTPTGALVGGENGLFSVADEGLESLDDIPVRGLAAYAGEVFVARDDGLFVLEDGALEPSPITDSLPGLQINAMATRGEELWLGTEDGLFAYTSETVTHFAAVSPVTAVGAATGADYVVFAGGAPEGIYALAPNGADWGLLDFGSDPVDVVAPGRSTLLYGLIGDKLVARVEGDTGFVWRGVALEAGIDAPAATGVTALATAPNSATVWAVTDTHFIEIAGGLRTLVAREGLTSNEFTVDGTGTLWVSDGTTLSSLPGASTEAVTWTEHIAPFAQNNCDRCHGELATASEIYTLEDWQNTVDEIISQLAAGDMPADGAALEGGDVDLIRAWKEGGLQE